MNLVLSDQETKYIIIPKTLLPHTVFGGYILFPFDFYLLKRIRKKLICICYISK